MLRFPHYLNPPYPNNTALLAWQILLRDPRYTIDELILETRAGLICPYSAICLIKKLTLAASCLRPPYAAMLL